MKSDLFHPALRLIPPLLAALLAACAQTTPQFDQHFGGAVRAAMAQQVLDPAAAANTDAVTGMDGRSAAAALGRYQKSFSEPAPREASFTIGLGSGK